MIRFDKNGLNLSTNFSSTSKNAEIVISNVKRHD